jgi:hypothetical protein
VRRDIRNAAAGLSPRINAAYAADLARLTGFGASGNVPTPNAKLDIAGSTYNAEIAAREAAARAAVLAREPAATGISTTTHVEMNYAVVGNGMARRVEVWVYVIMTVSYTSGGTTYSEPIQLSTTTAVINPVGVVLRQTTTNP